MGMELLYSRHPDLAKQIERAAKVFDDSGKPDQPIALWAPRFKECKRCEVSAVGGASDCGGHAHAA